MKKLATVVFALAAGLSTRDAEERPYDWYAFRAKYPINVGKAKLDNDIFDLKHKDYLFRLPQELYVPDGAQDQKPYRSPLEVEP